MLTQMHSLLDIFTHVSCEFRLIAVADQLDVKWSPLKQRLLTTLNLQVELYLYSLSCLLTVATGGWSLFLPCAAALPVLILHSRRCAGPYPPDRKREAVFRASQQI